MIYDLHQVWQEETDQPSLGEDWEGFPLRTLIFQQIKVRDNESEMTDPDFPPWVWHGIRTEGWDVTFEGEWRDTSAYEPTTATQPDWMQVAEVLALAGTNKKALAVAMDRYHAAEMEQAMYDDARQISREVEALREGEPDEEPEDEEDDED